MQSRKPQGSTPNFTPQSGKDQAANTKAAQVAKENATIADNSDTKQETAKPRERAPLGVRHEVKCPQCSLVFECRPRQPTQWQKDLKRRAEGAATPQTHYDSDSDNTDFLQEAAILTDYVERTTPRKNDFRTYGQQRELIPETPPAESQTLRAESDTSSNPDWNPSKQQPADTYGFPYEGSGYDSEC